MPKLMNGPKWNSGFCFSESLNVRFEVLNLPTQIRIDECQLTTLLQNATNPSNLHLK